MNSIKINDEIFEYDESFDEIEGTPCTEFYQGFVKNNKRRSIFERLFMNNSNELIPKFAFRVDFYLSTRSLSTEEVKEGIMKQYNNYKDANQRKIDLQNNTLFQL